MNEADKQAVANKMADAINEALAAMPDDEDTTGVIDPAHPDRPKFGFAPMRGISLTEFPDAKIQE